MRARLPLACLAWLLSSAPGCGYVGFETSRDADAPVRVDAGRPDADQPEPEDAAEPDAELEDASVDIDAASDGAVEMDGDLMDAASDTGALSDSRADVDELDASVPGDADAGDALDAAVDARPATQISDYCTEVPALPAAPVIDGVVDGMLQVVTLTPGGWTGSGGSTLPAHTTAEYALAFRPDGLYVYVRVFDPNRLPPLAGEFIWRGDGVELYADDDGTYTTPGSYDNPGSTQIIVAAPVDGTTPSTRATRFVGTVDQGAWASTQFAAFPRADGYAFEGFLEAAALNRNEWTLRSGARIGVDLGVNVSALDEQIDAGVALEGQRLGQYFLRIGNAANCGGWPFCTTDAFCSPVLVD
jgi:hypothetical protein